MSAAGLAGGRRVALVHDWLTGMRGGEKVLEELGALFPEAPIFTLIHLPGTVSAALESHPIRTSFLQRLPGVATRYRSFLPLMPAAAEALDLSGFDLIVSTSHCVAKGVVPDPGALHLCYCHTPMRYVWDQRHAYFGPGRASWAKRVAITLVGPWLRTWDVGASARVDRFVANSDHVRGRIRRYYGRAASVVHPPVDVEAMARVDVEPGDFYLCAGALAPYKRVDLAIDACRRLGRRLVVAGSGPELEGLRRRAEGEVEFVERPDDATFRRLLASCRALLFPGLEDFGIVPVEAQAAGRPVIAYGAGGALETVVGLDGPEAPTGVLFGEQSAEAIAEAIVQLERRSAELDPIAIRARAERFSPARFRAGVCAEVEALVAAPERAEVTS